MNIYKIFAVLSLVFVTSLSFAEKQKVILFLESLDGISPNVIKQVAASDNLCFCTRINNPKSVAASIKELIITNKVEPTLYLEEPYFPLISDNISNDQNIDIDRTDDLKNLLSRYKKSFRKTFEKRKTGLFLSDGIVNIATLDIFYNQNISWFTTSLNNTADTPVFFSHGTVIFKPYTDFPVLIKEIKPWLSEKKDEFIPVFIKSDSVKNEAFMTYLFKFLNKNISYEPCLPINAAYITAKKSDYSDSEISVAETENLPNDILIKITNAAKETELHNTEEEQETYDILHGELSSLYSSKVINGILNKEADYQRLFDISYSNIFRFAGKEIPDEESLIDLNQQTNNEDTNLKKAAFVRTAAGYRIKNDNIIKYFYVKKGSEAVKFEFNYDTDETDYLTIYIDMNGMANAGCQTMLNKTGFFVPENCWEYALKVKDSICEIYRFSSDNITKVKTISLTSPYSLTIPNTILRGNPYNWNYQIITVKDNIVNDFICTTKEQKEKILSSQPLLIEMISTK